MLKPGEKLHQYVIEAEVGGSGMSRVYRARHTVLGSLLALKVLDPYWAKQNKVRSRLLAEGRIQALVAHPSIVSVCDVVVDEKRDVAALVMEFVEGPNLQQLINRLDAPPPTEVTRDLFRQILRGMYHAHEEGVIHRDLKPANILLSRDAKGDWYPRVGGFEVAFVMGDSHSQLSGIVPPSSKGLGTPGYMCPEQINGSKRPTAQWDVFSLGVTLYQLATCKHPFLVKDETETLQATVNGHFRAPRELIPAIDDHIEAAICGALAVNPDDRFYTIAEFDAALTGELVLPAPGTNSIIEGPNEVTVPRALLPEATLLMPDSPERRQEWAVMGFNTTIGSGDGSNITMSGEGVERVHFLLRFADGIWLLEDLSKTGTRVNGARIKSIQLDNGDVIRIGRTLLQFRANADPQSQSLNSIDGVVSPRDGWLEYREGGIYGKSRRIPVSSRGVLIGRDTDIDLVIADPGVSRRHCKIAIQGLHVTVEDLRSANGTFVDGHRVRLRRLDSGDTISVGPARIKFFRAR
ncbi:MAG: FHA domain-containing protein [Proteobacteria bacterium]|jgi:serine/threonine protein kinase|nr:FHA domain-containing protein [Pseudomonadota bacterium]